MSLKDMSLEEKKLILEIEELKYRNSWLNRLIGAFLTTFVTISLAFLSLKLQSIDRDNQTFISLIEQATTAETPEGRIAGIWMLDSYWDKNDSNRHKLIANALSGILMSEENFLVRLAAAEVLGNAYDQADWNTKKNQEKLESLRLLLYGNGSTGKYGTLTSANWWLSQDCIKQAEDAQAENLCQDKLFATKEAIRKNWENLENVHLRETDLSTTQLYESNLSRANLSKAQLQKTNFHDANLSRANLIDANLQQADLRGANFQKALYNKNTNFQGVKLSPNTKIPDETMYLIEPGSKLIDADLSELPLEGANLNGANLSNANLSKSNLSRANLSNANLSAANLNEAIFKDTKYNENTIFPEKFNPETAGMIKVE